MTNFEGRWKYQSFFPTPLAVTADPTPVTFNGWSPPAVLTVYAGGTTGVLEFTGLPIKLDLTIRVTDGSPARLSISAVWNRPTGGPFTNELEGFFVPADLAHGADECAASVVRGAIVQTSTDIAPTNPKPVFTTGYFVLEPLPATP